MSRPDDIAGQLAAPAAIPEVWTLTRKTYGASNRYVVECDHSIRSISEEDEPTLYRFFTALAAAPPSPVAPEQDQAKAEYADSVDVLLAALEEIDKHARAGLQPKRSSSDLRTEFKRIINCARYAFNESFAVARLATPAASADAVIEAKREQVRDAVADAMDGLYHCGRVWSAWGVGTMSEDDFSPANEDEDIISNVVDAVFDALKSGVLRTGEGAAS